MEHGRWKTWLNSMSPERLAQQRAYENEKGKRYYQEHKEERQARLKKNITNKTKKVIVRNMCVSFAGVNTSRPNRHSSVKQNNQRATQGIEANTRT